ncbi:MAG: FAD-dependent thymidylate synthase [Firmicutes bacterium]|nr:FAD-dependent thymidylate synthase [Bacillota bacterium]
MKKKTVLNSGYVELVEWMGSDNAVIRNARRCWKSQSKGTESDLKLLKHLLRKGHKTPFEAAVFTFDIKCPLFVARQWFRHRMASYNEESLRYSLAEREYFIPDDLPAHLRETWVEHHEESFNLYEKMIAEHYMRREIARSILPVGIYTSFYWTVNGSSLQNFLMLRTDRQAQKEIREYALVILELVKKISPLCFRTFEEVVLQKGGILS